MPAPPSCRSRWLPARYRERVRREANGAKLYAPPRLVAPLSPDRGRRPLTAPLYLFRNQIPRHHRERPDPGHGPSAADERLQRALVMETSWRIAASCQR
jgi:hypothetical protein